MKTRIIWASAILAGAALAAAQTMQQAPSAPALPIPPGYPTTPVNYEAPANPAVVAEPMGLAIQPAEAYKAVPVPLADVRLTGGPLKRAQDLDAAYLLSLDPDRMMYYLRQCAGLQPKAQSGYGGWDAGQGKQLTGHISGHYLSAISYMYAATGDQRFKDRVDYLVKEFAEVQAKQGDGYIGAQTTAQGVAGKDIYAQVKAGTIRSGGFDLNGLWSPWYVEHKIFSGLRDAYRLTGNKEALEVEKKFAAWMETIVDPLSQPQDQQMLATEFGGINESLACLYADTGDKRWLALSDKFEHLSLITPLSQGQDVLNGKHGNTQVPKLLGDLMRYEYSGNEVDGKAATFFWDEVALHHSFATGGHGSGEYFGRPDQLSTMLVNPTARTCESCNVYNMVKYTREMFALDPLVKYADFQERALFNHILASINPVTGQTSYMVPVGQGVTQEYQNMLGQNEDFTCCVGTGMESQALHAYGIYYAAGAKVWVNIFAPSTAQLKDQGVKLEMETNFPDGESATLKVTAAAGKELTLALRRPYWAGEGYSVKVNGQAVADVGKPDSYVEIKRVWKEGDTVTMTLPKKLWADALVDDPTKAALMWGPLVLAGDLGGRAGGRRGGGASPSADATGIGAPDAALNSSALQLVAGTDARGEPMYYVAAPAGGAAAGGAGRAGGGRAGGRAGGGRGRGGPAGPAAQVYPAFVSAAPLDQWLQPVDGPVGTFQAVGQGAANNANTITFIPFYRTYNRRYGIYWDVLTPQQWQQRSGQLASDQQKAERLRAATVAFVQPGQMQPETDYNYQAGESTQPLLLSDHAGRRAATWFSFDVPVEESHPMALVVTYSNDEPAHRAFDVLVDGKKVGDRTEERKGPQEPTAFTEVSYDVSADLVKGKTKVTVRFEGTGGSEVGGVYGIRMVRKDMQ